MNFLLLLLLVIQPMSLTSTSASSRSSSSTRRRRQVIPEAEQIELEDLVATNSFVAALYHDSSKVV